MTAPAPLEPHPDRLLPPEPGVRAIARRLYEAVRALPIVSPHGHVDLRLLLDDNAFSDPATLLVTPDHYVTRLLHASGVSLDALGVGQGRLDEARAREVWRHLCAEEAYRPRALYGRFDIAVLATTDDPCDDLAAHTALAADPAWKGRVVPVRVEYTLALRPLLERYGTHPNLHLVLFTVDETVFSRELAPLAGFYPSVYVGAPWWFLDAPDAIRRFRAAVTETVGFTRTSGFIDDTRAFCSIPARHDMSRRIDAGFLANLVAGHRLDQDEAHETLLDLVTTRPREVFKL
jgi:glucuronate isomerase